MNTPSTTRFDILLCAIAAAALAACGGGTDPADPLAADQQPPASE